MNHRDRRTTTTTTTTSMQGLPTKHDSHTMTATLTENNDKLVNEHGKLSLHGMSQPPSKDTPKWWECGGHVRGKKQSREINAAGESGRDVTSGQDVTEKEKPKSTKFACELAGHRPGLLSDLGGVAGSWLAQPRPGAAVQTKEAARVADGEARGLASQAEAEAPKQAKL